MTSQVGAPDFHFTVDLRNITILGALQLVYIFLVPDIICATNLDLSQTITEFLCAKFYSE